MILKSYDPKSRRKDKQDEWARLKNLRELFISEGTISHEYWSDPQLLASYDKTFGARIGWKWDTVIAQLKQAGWFPPKGTILDWGCGSGVAIRRWLANWSLNNVEGVILYDRSTMALCFAREELIKEFPQLRITTLSPDDMVPKVDILLISHVIKELDEESIKMLLRQIKQAQVVVWVEAAELRISRQLSAIREELRPLFQILLPCPHSERCGVLAPESHDQWCHFFAHVPPGILNDPEWVRFRKETGIDLRSLPYSALVADQRASQQLSFHTPCPEGYLLGRVIGRPDIQKGILFLYVCHSGIIERLRLIKRTDPKIFNMFDKRIWPTWIAFKKEYNQISQCIVLDKIEQ